MPKKPAPLSALAAAVTSTAALLSDLGYYVLPVHFKTKACVIKDWQHLHLDPTDIPSHFDPRIELNLGVLLGVSRQEGALPAALDIDVDDPALIEAVSLAFPVVPPAKKGKKGITYFCRTGGLTKKRYLKKKNSVGAWVTAIELLADGQQVVIPPSIHPDGMAYDWVGDPLTDFKPDDLPLLNSTTMSEIEIAVKKPDSPIFLLNSMRSSGGKGGGTVHNSVLTAVAALVALGWDDDFIWVRVARAVRRSVILSGLDFEDSEYAMPAYESKVRKMVADAKEKGFDQTQQAKEKPEIHVARWMLNEWRGSDMLFNSVGKLAAYKDGCYEHIGIDRLRHVIATTCTLPILSRSHRDLMAAALTVLDLAPPLPLPTRRRVVLLNGTFDMDDGTLYQWNPADYLISHLDFEFDPEAECPVYDEFIRRTFAGDPDEPHSAADVERSIETYEEFISHTLFECLDYHRFLVILGKPRTGKSTLAKIARMLHGPDAISNVAVQDMGNERYRTTMVGKLLNVVSEVAAMTHAADDFLKAITAGDDVQVRHLYGETFSVQLPARIMVVTNEMFRVRDTSGAIEERMLVLSCNNYVPESERDIHLMNKLKLERPGIFNRMVRAWGRLRDRKSFDPPSTHGAEVEQFSEESNHVLQWVMERTIQGQKISDPEFKVPDTAQPQPSGVLYLDFAEWMKANGFKPMSSVTWGKKLCQIKGADLKPKNVRLGGRVVKAREITLITQGSY